MRALGQDLQPRAREPDSGDPGRWPVRWARPATEARLPGRRFVQRPERAGRFVQLLRALPKNILLYVFRVAPYPVPPGLLILGRPTRTSPVLVTTNYELTVRRVVRSLEGADAYLLVAPAGGMNVWCAAGGGQFTVDSLLSILKTTGIAARVNHRSLILPQLAASGMRLSEVRDRTGWKPLFGPVRAQDLRAFFERDRRKTDGMCRVGFTAADRIEMAVALWGSLSLRYGWVPLLALGPRWAAGFSGSVAAIAAVLSLAHETLPGKTFIRKAGAAALVPILAALAAFLGFGLSLPSLACFLVLVIGAAALTGSSFAGYTPLRPCGYSRLFFGRTGRTIEVARQHCARCGLCRDVCPVGCFAAASDGTYERTRPDLCEDCGACLLNCPSACLAVAAASPGGRAREAGRACGVTNRSEFRRAMGPRT